ncbi:hypothetical protein [Curtobacterium sp. SORGH_AS_0776]|uniref:hypothetical protein n=1 Tax=unclassified Curtobacterium TaxID=257496 RepID=UPI00089DEA17|nr:hypothetical protein [Curtobacterium sp. SORGH_AS_0776]AOX66180.1 hypothetical protein BJK06_10800 [Curtobacterium sp. BH-2-1-1]MDR6169179.1 hypothetical protein [Curtobacterium sp. SORGH_AS_0776]OII21468.1 hypothetical protein BIV01_01655 [Curtobacterium sp. MCBA15_013]SFF98924.1 hypothetical protein SAMN05216329_3498 [Curtobacterium sp. YR515]
MTEVSNDERDPERDARPGDPDQVRTDDHAVTDDFGQRTAAAESLPLAERADAFSALHDELRTRLESGGSTSA